MPYAMHIHAKFYEITADYKDVDIPHDEIIPLILQSGYTGYLLSEYEGQASTTQVTPKAWSKFVATT